ncbi:formylglycine-generating enzyme family protein, partial [Kaarinaea lacus]
MENFVKEIRQDSLASGGYAPKIVSIPPGQFMMGSPDDEPGRYYNEGPQHLVTFMKPFYLGLTEVTVGQFRQFVEATGYQTDAERNTGSFLRDITEENAPWRLRKDVNWRMDHEGKPSNDKNPVVHVSWNDAQAYLAWLSKETGNEYRLPSEAELEYSNRAGSEGLYWWGEGSPQDNLTNVRGDKDKAVANPKTWER